MNLRSIVFHILLVFLVVVCSSCSSDFIDSSAMPDGDSDATVGDSEAEEVEREPTVFLDAADGCVHLIASACAYPYPSMPQMVEDSDSPTGYRLALNETMLPFEEQGEGERADFFERLNSADGFSVATPLLALFPDVHVDEATLPSLFDLEASVSPESSVQIFDRSTGERLPVWAEMDNYAKTGSEPAEWLDDERSMIIRPQKVLAFNRRYAVVVTTGVKDDNGASLPIPPAMQALLDDAITDSTQIEAQREDYESLFTFLEEQGLQRNQIVLAWEFHTMSREFAQEPLLAILDAAQRDQASGSAVLLGKCQASDPQDRADYDCEDEPDLQPAIWRRQDGKLQLPNYLNEKGLIDWQDGLPVRVESHEVDFVSVLPQSVKDAEAGSVPVLQIGHGLMSETWRYLMVDADDNGTLAMTDRLGMMAVGADLKGLATDDIDLVVAMLRNFHTLFTLHDALLQGMADWSLVMPVAAGALSNYPFMMKGVGEPLVDLNRKYYYGVSLGAIAGAVLAATMPGVDNYVLHVGGGGFSALLQHSAEFLTFQLMLDLTHSNRITQQLILALAQRALDPIDPANWGRQWFDDPLPEREGRNILWQTSWGDSNSPDFGNYLLARSFGIPLVKPTTHEVYGLDLVRVAPTGPGKSGIVIYDAGKEPPSYDNAGTYDNGAHFALRCNEEVQEQIKDFLKKDEEGNITLHCGGEACFIDGIDCRTSLGE